MENDIQSILEDLYQIDPSLKGQEDDLKKLVEKLIQAKPDVSIDESFMEGLRKQLNSRVDELKEVAPKSNFMTAFNRFFYPFAGGVLGFAIIVVVFLQFNTPFKSALSPEPLEKTEVEESLPHVDKDMVIPPTEEPVEEPGEKSLPPSEPVRTLPNEPAPAPGAFMDNQARTAQPVADDPIASENGTGEGDGTTTEIPVPTSGMAPAMMMESMPAMAPEAADVDPSAIVRDQANLAIEQAEQILQDKKDQISDELRQSIVGKINTLKALLGAENEDIGAIQKATETLSQELGKI